MRTRVGLKRCPITPPQRAAMRAAMQQVQRIFDHGVTPEQQAQARAALDALATPRQRQLPLKVIQ